MCETSTSSTSLTDHFLVKYTLLNRTLSFLKAIFLGLLKSLIASYLEFWQKGLNIQAV